jgi:hypothetical protein
MILPTFYIVATEYPRMGLGSANDLTPSRDRAYDDYAEAVQDGQPARAFMLQFDVETNAFETACEVTDEFHSELHSICADRGIAEPEAA